MGSAQGPHKRTGKPYGFPVTPSPTESQAQLAASLTADWGSEERTIAQALLSRLSARERAKASQVLRVHLGSDAEAVVAALADGGSRHRSLPAPDDHHDHRDGVVEGEDLRAQEVGVVGVVAPGGAREGLAYARRSPRVLVTLFVVLMLSTFCFNFNVLLPVLAKQTLHGGPAVFGILSACFGAGAGARNQDVDSAFIADLKRRNVGYIPTLTRDVAVFEFETTPAYFSDPFFVLVDTGAWLESFKVPGGTRPNAQLCAISQNEVRLYQLDPKP